MEDECGCGPAGKVVLLDCVGPEPERLAGGVGEAGGVEAQCREVVGGADPDLDALIADRSDRLFLSVTIGLTCADGRLPQLGTVDQSGVLAHGCVLPPERPASERHANSVGTIAAAGASSSPFR